MALPLKCKKNALQAILSGIFFGQNYIKYDIVVENERSRTLNNFMKILLAGYNLDYDLIRTLKDKSALTQDLTPETISAAYARISRSPKPVNELREISREEVDKARQSNRNIVFEMGHSSVAEHAVFNIDVIGTSRFLIEGSTA